MSLLRPEEKRIAKKLRANGQRKHLPLAGLLQSLLAREKHANRENALPLGEKVRQVITKMAGKQGDQKDEAKEDISGFILCHQFFGGTHKIIENLLLFS